MAINKVIYGGDVIMDITDTTATADLVDSSAYFYTNAGVKTKGTSTKDSDTTDANASASEILSGQTAYVNKNKVTGSMPNNGAVSGTISTKAGAYTVRLAIMMVAVLYRSRQPSRIKSSQVTSRTELPSLVSQEHIVVRELKSRARQLLLPQLHRQFSRTVVMIICHK